MKLRLKAWRKMRDLERPREREKERQRERERGRGRRRGEEKEQRRMQNLEIQLLRPYEIRVMGEV